MSCTSPCLSCTSNNFYSCLSCDTSLSSSYILSGSQCIITPTWYIQLACTCMLFLFIILPLLRKRSMVLIKILDIIQTVAFFKYIKAYIFYRHNYLYLQMRSMSPWSEGWQLLSVSNDLVSPIFLTDQTYINKLIRIASIWVGMILIVLLVGVFKINCRDGKLQFGTFISKNIPNAICIAFYVTVQDIAFYCAANLLNLNFSSILGIVHFVVAIILLIVVFILVIWQFLVVNYKYEQQKQTKLYNYEMMFLYRMDYDLFQTYSLTNLPQRQKKIHRYSNIAILDILRKIGYAFLIVSFISNTNTLTLQTLQTQIFSLLGYLVFFQLVWYISMLFDPKKQVLQLILNILADLLMIALLIIPLFVNSSSFDFIYFILCLSLFGLAVISALLQIVLNLYTFIPYDLYNLGLNVVILDKELKQELDRRNKQMQQNQKKIKELQQEQQRLLDQLKKQKQNLANKTSSEMKPPSRKPTISRQNDSQHEINQPHQKNQPLDQISQATLQKQQLYPVQEGSQQNELDCYKIDTKKKRMVYSFNKKVPFVYSNKVDE